MEADEKTTAKHWISSGNPTEQVEEGLHEPEGLKTPRGQGPQNQISGLIEVHRG